MKHRGQRKGIDCERQLKQAKDRIAEVEARVERARSRAELAEQRTELAETRTELAETRTALAETRAEQAEALLQRVVQNRLEHENDEGHASEGHRKNRPPTTVNQGRPLEHLSHRQREILQHIAEGQNTKEIADFLNVSPKTVEYHRARLMDVLDVHDIPGLVRLAVRAGLVPAES